KVDRKLCFRRFELRRRQKTADTGQVGRELRIVWFVTHAARVNAGDPGKAHRIESKDIIRTRLKLIGLEEELRHVDAIALGGVARAIINRAGPTSKARQVRLATQKINVLLTHKEVRVVDWIGSVYGFIVVDRDRGVGRCSQSGALRIAESHPKRFASFGIRIVHDGHGETLW